jgi:hypothetical protein
VNQREREFILTGLNFATQLGLLNEDDPDDVKLQFQRLAHSLHKASVQAPKKEAKFSDDLKEKLGIIPKEMGQWIAAAVMFDLGMRGLSSELAQATTATVTELALAGWIRQVIIAAFVIRAVLPENINIKFELGSGQKK